MQLFRQRTLEHGRSQFVERIVYASRARIEGSVYAAMERIRASAVRHNEPAEVHTALLYQSGWFVQWKEGPSAAVSRIMDRVARDPRHHSLCIVHRSHGVRLLDGPWSMAIVQCEDAVIDMAQRVAQLRLAMDSGAQYAPPVVWRRLSTPMRHPGASRQDDADAFQRVLVCAAAGQASFELVRWLAQRHDAEVVHRRFADAHHLDVGTDYIDFVDDDRVMRVIAMARRGLSVPLTRAFIPDYSHALVLLRGDEERDTSLVLRLAQACAGLVSPPTLLAVASTSEAHAQPLALARKLGLRYMPAIADPSHAQECWSAVVPLLNQRGVAANGGAASTEARSAQ